MRTISNICAIISNHNSEGHLHVFDMKTGKSDGFDGLSSDYCKHGTDLLYVYLSCLFNLCVSTLIHI